MRLVVIGGSDVGISAGLRARELNPSLDVQVVLADGFPNYSMCGLPFYVSGETPDWRQLAHRGEGDLRRAGLKLLEERRVLSIDPGAQEVAGGGQAQHHSGRVTTPS